MHQICHRAGFVSVRKQFIFQLVNRLDESEINKIAKEISRETKDFVLLLRNEYRLESILDVIQTWIRISGYKYKSEIKGSQQFHIIQHDMGKKWSFFLAKLIAYIFEDFDGRKVDFYTKILCLAFHHYQLLLSIAYPYHFLCFILFKSARLLTEEREFSDRFLESWPWSHLAFPK